MSVCERIPSIRSDSTGAACPRGALLIPAVVFFCFLILGCSHAVKTVPPPVSMPGDFSAQGENPLPGVAQVAIQEGRYVAEVVHARVGEAPAPPPFRYRDRGSMAVIGRGAGVAELGRVRLHGWLAWLAWLFVHLMALVDFENRLLVFIQWAWNYFTWNRGARLITGESPFPLRRKGDGGSD